MRLAVRPPLAAAGRVNAARDGLWELYTSWHAPLTRHSFSTIFFHNILYVCSCYTKGCGLKYRGSPGQPLTRGPEADETRTMAVTLPHRARVSLS